MRGALATALGRLGAPGQRGAYDAARFAMIDQLIAANQSGTLTGSAWLAVWSDAMTRVRDTALLTAGAELNAAGAESRYPQDRLRSLRPDQERGDILLQRLLSQGLELERLVPGDDNDGGVFRARGAALEAAWTGAVRLADADVTRWRGVADEVARWRRPYRRLVMVAGPIIGVTTLVGCWIGGIIAAPQWFEPVTNAFWRLPWP